MSALYYVYRKQWYQIVLDEIIMVQILPKSVQAKHNYGKKIDSLLLPPPLHSNPTHPYHCS